MCSLRTHNNLINARQQAGLDLHSGVSRLRSGPLLGRYGLFRLGLASIRRCKILTTSM